MTPQAFGGNWTEQKLSALHGYLSAYTHIFRKNPSARFYTTHYVDVFAGTGYMQRPELSLSTGFFPELSEGAEEYMKGSAVRALEVEPPFDHYVFVERHGARSEELSELKAKFPARAPFIDVRQGNAATVLQQWCGSINWKENRAVLFLDPFGMDVEWPLLEVIARTRGIDLWYLFPLFAVNRLLVRGQVPPEAWAFRLTETFGTESWRKEFYSDATDSTYPLFHQIEPERRIKKTANIDSIKRFLVGRLQSIFVAVSEALVLENSKNCPLYLLLFAAGNDKGAKAGPSI